MRRLRVTRVSVESESGEYIEISANELRSIVDEGIELIESGQLDEDTRDDEGDDEDDDEDEEDETEPDPGPFGGRLRVFETVSVSDN